MPLSYAEVTFDNSVGGPVTANVLSGDIVIPELRGDAVGNNLLHSFAAFNVNNGEAATFTGSSEVVNIIARVTGGGGSNIDGPLETRFDNSDPNLFLINPAGIIFGPGASVLKVEGSFHASTADFIDLEGFRFHASLQETSTLTSAEPVAFGFLSDSAASIQINNSTLEVSPEKTLSMIGGDIIIKNGKLIAPQGTINLLSQTDSEGKVRLDAEVLGNATDLGDIQISAEISDIDVGIQIQDSSRIEADTAVIRGGGFMFSGVPGGDNDPFIRIINEALTTVVGDEKVDIDVSGDLTIDHDAKITWRQAGAKIEIDAATFRLTNRGSIRPSAVEGNITINVDELILETGGRITAGTTSSNTESGNITITADERVVISGSSLEEQSRIDSSTFGGAKTGSISVNSPSIVVSDDALIQATSRGESEEGENSGDITLVVDQLHINSGGQVTNSASDNATGGIITITANESIDIAGKSENNPSGIRSETDSSGNGGSIVITSPDIKLSSEGFISARTVNSGSGGAITINAGSGTIAISGQGSTITTESVGNEDNNGIAGSGGNIMISAGRFVVDDHGQITTGTSSTGNAGELLSVTVGSLMLRDGGNIAAGTSADGRGGNIKIDAREIELSNGASVSATSTDTVANLAKTPDEGRAGNITITGLENLRLSDSTIEVKTAESNAGNIIIDAADAIQLTNTSSISTSAAVDPDGQGTGNGGNIEIGGTTSPRVVVLDADSEILARAKKDNGGRIDIVTDFFIGPVENVDASSTEGGIDGEVDITGEVEVIGGTIPLQEGYLDATALFDKPCAARTGGASSLVALDSRGLPANPDNLLPAATPAGGEAHRVAQNNPRSASKMEHATSLQPAELLLAGCQ